MKWCGALSILMITAAALLRFRLWDSIMTKRPISTRCQIYKISSTLTLARNCWRWIPTLSLGCRQSGAFSTPTHITVYNSRRSTACHSKSNCRRAQYTRFQPWDFGHKLSAWKIPMQNSAPTVLRRRQYWRYEQIFQSLFIKCQVNILCWFLPCNQGFLLMKRVGKSEKIISITFFAIFGHLFRYLSNYTGFIWFIERINQWKYMICLLLFVLWKSTRFGGYSEFFF